MATFLVFLLLPFSSFFASAEVSWNIDCGSSASSYTDTSGMVWVGDSNLIKSGKSKSVPSSNSFSHVDDSLRVFTSGEKNCYSLKAEKGVKVLVQAFFFYGNYDGKSSPPSFDLEIDGNDWITIETSMETHHIIYSELVYALQRDHISVCLVQTHPSQFPFISALRVQSLPSSMYSALDSKHAMINRARYAFGSGDTIRFPADVYGRIWDTLDLPESKYISVASEASQIDTSAVADDIPESVMENAVTTASGSNGTLQLNPPDLPSRPSPVYITMYFTEVSKLDSTQKRSFSIYVDDELMESTKALSPIYGSATQLSIYNITVSENTTFTFLPTNDSTLPPLISAMEIYKIVNYTLPSSDSDSETSSSSSSTTSTKPPAIPGIFVLISLVIASFFASGSPHDTTVDEEESCHGRMDNRRKRADDDGEIWKKPIDLYKSAFDADQ